MSKPTLQIRRVYDEPGGDEGLRVLVDRLWPRGVKKDAAAIDRWEKDLAPSDALRKWFGHDPARWAEFKRRYFKELAGHKDRLHALLDAAAQRGTLTLVYAAKDRAHNNAAALKDYLGKMKQA